MSPDRERELKELLAHAEGLRETARAEGEPSGAVAELEEALAGLLAAHRAPEQAELSAEVRETVVSRLRDASQAKSQQRTESWRLNGHAVSGWLSSVFGARRDGRGEHRALMRRLAWAGVAWAGIGILVFVAIKGIGGPTERPGMIVGEPTQRKQGTGAPPRPDVPGDRQPQAPLVRNVPNLDGQDGGRPSPPRSPRGPERGWLAQRVEYGRITAVVGEPWILLPGDNLPRPVSVGTAIASEMTLCLGEADRCEVRYGDGSTLRLGEWARLVHGKDERSLRTASRPKRVRLDFGSLYAKIVDVPEGEDRFEVETPVATASVIGTEFTLTVQEKGGQRTNRGSGQGNPPAESSHLEAILSVSSGVVEFVNKLGSKTVPYLSESRATADSPPSQPVLRGTIRQFIITNANEHPVATAQPVEPALEPWRLVFPVHWSGVWVADVDPTFGTGNETPTKEEARVTRVVPGSAGDLAGIRVGDVVEALNGRKVYGAREVLAEFAAPSAASVELGLMRKGEPVLAKVRPEKHPYFSQGFWIAETLPPGLANAALSLIRGDDANAEKLLAATVSAYPNSAAAHSNLAVLYDSQENMALASRHYDAAVRLAPKNALYRFNRAWFNFNVGYVDNALADAEASVRLAPNWFKGLSSLSWMYWVAGRQRESLSVAERTARKFPNEADAWVDLADAHWHYQHAEEAEAASLKALAIEPDFDMALLALGRASYHMHKDKECRAAYQKVLAVHPSHPDVWQNLAELNEREGRNDEAEQAYLLAIERNPTKAPNYGNLGLLYRNLKRFDDAERIFRKGIEVDPTSGQLYSNYGGMLAFFPARQQEAKELLIRAIVLDPRNPITLDNLAFLLRRLGDIENAERLIKYEIEVAPKGPEGYYHLGFLYIDLKKWKEAEALMRRAIELLPEKPMSQGDLHFAAQAHGELGYILTNTDRRDEALREYEISVSLDPSMLGERDRIGEIRFLKGQFADALKAFQENYSRSPKNAHFVFDVAKAQHALGNLDEAEKGYRETLSLNANFFQAKKGLAWLLGKQGRSLDEALSLAESALAASEAVLQRDPGQGALVAEMTDGLGWVRFLRGELTEAEASIRRAIELFKNSPYAATSWYHIGQIEEKRGNKAAAIEAYRKSLSLNPDYKLAKEALDRIGGTL